MIQVEKTNYRDSVTCQALVIASPGSGHGKTILTAALARRYVNQGKRVQVFKIGPDYMDPTILECASKNTVYNLDLWIMGETHCQKLLYRAAATYDVILIESLMGFYDNEPSNAYFSAFFNLPVVLVINAAKYSQTAAAIIYGMKNYQKYTQGPGIIGIIGNCIGSNHHHNLIKDSISLVSVYLGSLRPNTAFSLPQRHLGLVRGSEILDLDSKLNDASILLDQSNIHISVQRVSFTLPEKEENLCKLLKGRVISIAKDAAFSFVYPENLQVLRDLGANYTFFSPLENEPVPSSDALWIPGGYPELHISELSKNTITKYSIVQHCQKDKPTLAECGGMMYLSKSINNSQGNEEKMCGVFSATCYMQDLVQSIGLQSYSIMDGELRGHSFHHSNVQTSMAHHSMAIRANGTTGEPIYRLGKITLSYMHFYFASHPIAIVLLFS